MEYFKDDTEFCFAISRKVNTYKKVIIEYGNPKVLNKNNNCKYFEQKPPTPKPTWWEGNGFWVLPLATVLVVGICLTFLCIFVLSK